MLSREAIDLARTTEDPATLAYALVARYAAMWSPDNQDERLEIADEIIELAVASGDDERKVEGHGYRFHALLELGDLGAAQAELSARAALTEKMKQPAQRWMQLILESGASLLTGDFAGADDSMHRAFELGSRTYTAPLTRRRTSTFRASCSDANRAGSARSNPSSRNRLARDPGGCCTNALSPVSASSSAGARSSSPTRCAGVGRLRRHLARRRLVARDGTLDGDEWGARRRLERGAALRTVEPVRPRLRWRLARSTQRRSRPLSRNCCLDAVPLARRRAPLRRRDGDERAHRRPPVAGPHATRLREEYVSPRGRGQDAEKAATLLQSALTTSRRLGMKPLADKVSALLSTLERTESTQVPTFAGYRIEAVLGRGGMGVVYRATDLSLERPVALKVIAPELAGDERFRERFLREPKLAAALDHPNVIPIYEAGEHDGQLYLAMRFVEGDDLPALELRRRSRPSARSTILGQVAGALDAAHGRGLVHRDVKPANMLLDARRPRLPDRLRRHASARAATRPRPGVVGTLDYLAPEQIRGEPVDGRTDQYALACVLYECLAGAPPFRRATEARRCGRTCTTSRRRCGRRSTPCCGGRWRRTRRSATRPAAS